MATTPMTTMQFLSLLAQHHSEGKKGPVVQITQKCEDEMESYFDAGMRARLLEIRDANDGVVEFVFDVQEFTDHNIPLEKPNYYDKTGNPCLTAGESGNRPEKRESIYFDLQIHDVYLLHVEEDDHVHALDSETHAKIVEALLFQREIHQMRVNVASEGEFASDEEVEVEKKAIDLINRALKQLRYKEDE